jgi:beta-phosphoglucomutase-like phosphatase (HAD superfamily)
MSIPDGTGYDALIFDWDGTLVDSQPLNYRALSGALAAYGVTMTAAWYRQRLGTSGHELIKQLALEQRIDRPLPVAQLERDCLASIRASIPEVTVNAVVADVARLAHGRRPLAVASGGAREVVLPALRHTGLRELFDVVVTGEDAPRGKPAPDLFARAADLLSVPAARCLVYEDSAEGLQAASNAGMAAVDVRPFLPCSAWPGEESSHLSESHE